MLGELAPSPRHQDEEHDDEEGDDEQPDDEAEDEVRVVEARPTRRAVGRVRGGRGPGWNETRRRGEGTERSELRDCDSVKGIRQARTSLVTLKETHSAN